MGNSANEDSAVEEYRTVAGDTNQPISWAALRMNPIGSDVPQVTSFRDLTTVHSWQSDGDDQVDLHVLPAGSDARGVQALALFETQIADVPREWGWSYRWPIFNPLRLNRVDQFGFEVFPDVLYDVLEISIILPRSTRKPRVRPLEHWNKAVPNLMSGVGSDSPWEFVIILERPEPGMYLWSVAVEEINADQTAPDPENDTA
jgi:hypothetical protein